MYCFYWLVCLNKQGAESLVGCLLPNGFSTVTIHLCATRPSNLTHDAAPCAPDIDNQQCQNKLDLSIGFLLRMIIFHFPLALRCCLCNIVIINGEQDYDDNGENHSFTEGQGRI